MKTEFDEYAAIEQCVRNSPPAEIRNRLAGAEGGEKSNIEMAIMTFVAIGDRPNLETTFPEFAHANPEHQFGLGVTAH